MEIDLTSPAQNGGSVMKHFAQLSSNRRAESENGHRKEARDRNKWRKSEVEVLDLTGI